MPHPKAPPLALKKGRFIKSRYFFDDHETGLYFDLFPLNRGAGDEDELNYRIDIRNRKLQGVHTGDVNTNYFCGLLLTKEQFDGMPDRHKLKFAGKTVLMLHDWGVKIEEVAQMRLEPWKAMNTDMFLWSSPDLVYTWASGDNLSYRFRSVPKSVVDAYDLPIQVPDPDTIPDPDDPIDPGSGTPGGELPGGGLLPFISLGGITKLHGFWNGPGGDFEINIEREE